MLENSKIVKWALSPKTILRQYKFHRRFVQVMQDRLRISAAGRNDLPPATSQWVFQDPSHLRSMEIIHQVYPNARIVWMHRKLRDQISCAVGRQFDTQVYGKNVPNIRSLLKNSDLTAMLDDAVTYRDSHTEPALFHDVHLEDLQADPLSVVRNLYAHYGMEVSPAHRAAMLDWLKRHFRAPVDYQLTLTDLGSVTRNELFQAHKNSKYTERFPRVLL